MYLGLTESPPLCLSVSISAMSLQIVVLAGGTNDFHAAAPPLEQWISDNLNFMSEVSFTGA